MELSVLNSILLLCMIVGYAMPAMILTLDNGPGFAKIRELERALDIQVYFEHPCARL